MAFIRRKTIKGAEYHYLVEGVRKDGKVRQRVICYLGRHSTVKSALAYWTRQQKAENSTDRKHARSMVAKLTPYL